MTAIGLEHGGRLDPAHARHLHVEQDQTERVGREHGVHRVDGFCAAGHGLAARAPGHELLAQDDPIRLVVVDDQDVQTVQVLESAREVSLGRILLLEAGIHVECAALTGRALERDPSAHQLDDALGDRQPETRSTVLPRRAPVGLRERLEDRLPAVPGDADPRVVHGDPDTDPGIVGGAQSELHLSGLGELDGIADEIVEDLLQSARVAAHGLGERGRERQGQLDLFRIRRAREELHHLFQGRAQVEVDQRQFQLACFHLGEVEDVVEDGHEPVGAVADRAGVLFLVRGQVGVQHQAGHADHGIHRRPDLVAHVREELALRAIGGLRSGESLGELGRALPDLAFDDLVGLLEIGAAFGDQTHLAQALVHADEQTAVLERDPPRMFEPAPRARREDAIDGLGPEDAAQEVLGSRHDGGRDEDLPVAVEGQEGKRPEVVEVRLDASAGELDEQAGEEHLGHGNAVARAGMIGAPATESDRHRSDEPAEEERDRHVRVHGVREPGPRAGRQPERAGDARDPLHGEQDHEEAVRALADGPQVLREAFLCAGGSGLHGFCSGCIACCAVGGSESKSGQPNTGTVKARAWGVSRQASTALLPALSPS